MFSLLCLIGSIATAATPWTVSGGYYGAFVTHPGLFVAAEKPAWRSGSQEVFFGGRGGGYHHDGRHTGLFARAEAGYRWTSGVGLFAEGMLGAGVLHTILDGPLYTEGATRSIDFGRPTFAPGLSLGVGWSRTTNARPPLRVFGRVDGWLRAPVNRSWLPGTALSLGIAWTPPTQERR